MHHPLLLSRIESNALQFTYSRVESSELPRPPVLHVMHCAILHRAIKMSIAWHLLIHEHLVAAFLIKHPKTTTFSVTADCVGGAVVTVALSALSSSHSSMKAYLNSV